MLPLSGELQLNTSGDQGMRPVISASGAYSEIAQGACPADRRAGSAGTGSTGPLRVRAASAARRFRRGTGPVCASRSPFGVGRRDMGVHEGAQLFAEFLGLGGIVEIHSDGPRSAVRVRRRCTRRRGARTQRTTRRPPRHFRRPHCPNAHGRQCPRRSRPCETERKRYGTARAAASSGVRRLA